MQVLKKVVRVCLAEIGSIHLESHEHDASPGCNAKVHLSNQSILFGPGPSRQWIEAMNIFPSKISLWSAFYHLGQAWKLTSCLEAGTSLQSRDHQKH